MSVWERSFRPNYVPPAPVVTNTCSWSNLGRGSDGDAVKILRDYSTMLREAKDDPPIVSAHLAPLFGAISAILGLSLRQTAYVFMLSHVKALISAAVRASMFGPFQAQKLLAGANVQSMIDVVIDREWATPVEEAGQSVPVMDLWIGRHELLYSRIFNS
jgi:urease accessory protein